MDAKLKELIKEGLKTGFIDPDEVEDLHIENIKTLDDFLHDVEDKGILLIRKKDVK